VARFEAERQALAIMDHPSIARLFDAGAQDHCQDHLGNSRETIDLLGKAIAGLTRKPGPDHPDTLEIRGLLAAAYQAAGRTKEALAIFEELLKLSTSKLGSNDPDTLAIRAKLAAIYDAVRQLDKSEPLFRDALEHAKKNFGPKDFRTSTAMASLGMSFLEQNKSAEAEPLLRECLAKGSSRLASQARTQHTRAPIGCVRSLRAL
jgi:tetratricopeptide (TPR) repeat protein